jgi:ribosomal protein S18 acetylase RimI-like enzyme
MDDGEDDSGDSSLVVRRAHVRDARHMYMIHVRSLAGVDREGLDWFRGLLRVRSRRVKALVAVLNREVVGFTIAYKGRDRAYIDYLAVDPRYRGMGIGSRLLRELEQLLAREGVEEVGLSVKDSNMQALQFYIKNGYVVRGVVLVLSARVGDIADGPLDGYRFQVVKGGVRGLKVKVIPTTWWSSLTEEPDRMVYERLRDEYTLLLYKGSRLKGLAEFSPRRVMNIDYIAVSYSRPKDALKTLVRALKEEATKRGVEELVVYIDGSKNGLINVLLELNFKTVRAEYRLSKGLTTG